ncbi:MAG: cell envelope integrity protein CreD [Dysgonomonas sp.]|nr:cell envelope integrity protein CreD [Dysgonomonas sp.]
MKANSKLSADTIIVKIIVVAVLALLMLLPVKLIEGLIDEREQNQKTVQDEISTKWGGSQQITGPILVLPYETIQAAGAVNAQKVINYAYFLPDTYNVTGDMKTEERKRTLYSSLVYQSVLKVDGKFAKPDYEQLNLKQDQIQWQNAFIMLGIPYLQGVKNKMVFNVNGKKLDVQPGLKQNHLVESGLTVNLPLDPEALTDYNFSFDLSLNGSEGLYFTPVGKENNIQLKSNWNTVVFSGAFLPEKRTVEKTGFDAQWNVFDYNRNYVQMWTGSNDNLRSSSLGVELRTPVDQYQMATRSAKYAIMFIALTFVVFFLVELLSKKRIHPVQYLLVSCALVLFYTLLLAISEQIGFQLAYLISAIATTGLITAYSTTMFHNIKQSAMMGVFLSGLYIYLYIILQLESLSLLFGAIGLFIALAIVMYVLRKVEWYKKKDEEGSSENDKSDLPPAYEPRNENSI